MIRNKRDVCARDRAIMPVSMKIFLLPKFATQSLRTPLLTTLRDSRGHCARKKCIVQESRKQLYSRHFLQS